MTAAAGVRGYIRPEIEHLAVPIRSVHPYPGNARRGNHTKIRDSLLTHGQYKPLLVQRTTGHILVGNNTWHVAAGEQGWSEIAVQYLDIGDDAARRLLLMDNASSDDSDYDHTALLELLAELPEFTGTGWDILDVDRLAAEYAGGTGLADLPSVEELLPVSPAGPPLPTHPTADPPQPPPDPTVTAPQPPVPGPIPTPAPTPDPGPTVPPPIPPADPRLTVLPPVLPPTPRPRDPWPDQASWHLTLPPADRDEARRLITTIRTWLAEDTLPDADIVLRGLRTLAAVADARHNPSATFSLTTLLMAAGRDPFTGQPQ